MKRLVAILLAGLCGGDGVVLDYLEDLARWRLARWERALGSEWALRMELASTTERAKLKTWARASGWEAKGGTLSWRGLSVARYRKVGDKFKFSHSSPSDTVVAEKLLDVKLAPDGRAWAAFEVGGKTLTTSQAAIDPSRLPRPQRLKLWEALWLPWDREALLAGEPSDYLREVGFKPLLSVDLPPKAQALLRERFRDERLEALKAQALLWAYQVVLADSMMAWDIKAQDPEAFRKLVLSGPLTLSVPELKARLKKLKGNRSLKRQIEKFKRSAEARFRSYYAQLQEALKSSPAERFYLLGVEAYVRGSYKTAERLWKKALEIDPSHEAARRALEDLRRRVD